MPRVQRKLTIPSKSSILKVCNRITSAVLRQLIMWKSIFAKKSAYHSSTGKQFLRSQKFGQKSEEGKYQYLGNSHTPESTEYR